MSLLMPSHIQAPKSSNDLHMSTEQNRTISRPIKSWQEKNSLNLLNVFPDGCRNIIKSSARDAFDYAYAYVHMY